MGFAFWQGSPRGDQDGHWYFSVYISLATFLGVLEKPRPSHWPDSGHTPITVVRSLVCSRLAKPEPHVQACGPVVGRGRGG